MASPSDDELARVVRAASGRLVALLARRIGNFDVAEEAVADAVVEALTAWRSGGVPDNPDGWLMAAARRNAIDFLRREQRYRDKLALLEEPVMTDAPDERLPLIFLCCHPALGRDAQLALTLRAVIGLTVPEIARALLVGEATVAARITRAKKKVVAAGIPLVTPAPDELADRLDHVLTVVYLAYNEGHLSTSGVGHRRDVAEDAIWLATLLATQLPREPEALGLLALLLLSHAREPARFAAGGSLVLMRDQDRSKWDAVAVAEATQLLERAAALHRPGRFQLQAAIAAVHAEAPTFEATDWAQILTLYDMLLSYDDSPVVRLNRAVVVAYAHSPTEALAIVDGLDELADYHLWHSTRAELLRAVGRNEDARAADEHALQLTANDAERSLITSRLGGTP